MNRIYTYTMASLALAIAIPASTIAQPEPDREQMMEMVMQMQQMQDEIRMLRGRIEEQAFEIETLKRRQRDQYLDLDQRITEAAAGTVILPGSAAGGSAAMNSARVPGEGQPARPVDVPELRAPTTTQSSVTGLDVPQAQARTAVNSPEAEQAAYDSAFQALKDLRYADAADEFQRFLQRYPNSDLADNAQYWLGESYYVTRNYELALDAFATLQDQFPESSKVPDSLLKIGYTHYELKQWDQARAALTQVQEQYPSTTLARLAESRLRSMRLEGHF